MTERTFEHADFKEFSPADLKRNFKKTMVPLPGTEQPGCTPVYRNALSKQGLIASVPGVTTTFEAFNRGLEVAGKNSPCFSHRPVLSKRDAKGDIVWGNWHWETRQQVSERRFNFGSGLIEIRKQLDLGDVDTPQWTFGIYATNRPKWVIADHAGWAYNLIPVALFDTLGPESIEYIVNHAEISILVCSLDKVQNVLKASANCPGLKAIVSMDSLDDSGSKGSQHHAISGIGANAGSVLKSWAEEKGIMLYSFEQVEELGKANRLAPRPPQPEDVATICYTSGTTGNPKGAVTTHANYCATSAGLQSVGVKFSPQDLHLSYLPLAHAYERISMIGMVFYGVPVAFYRGDVTLLFDDIADVKPTIFCSVPRLFNRIHAAILQKTVHSGSAITAALFNRAMAAKTESIKSSGSLTHGLWDRIIFNKIKNVLGGRVRLMISGSAPISAEVLMALRCCFSCEVLEGFGQTETAAVASVNWIGDYRAGGSIGPILPCTEVKLVDIPEMKYVSTDSPPRGEIVIRGPNIMRGYHKDPTKTAETIDEQGWLATGDVGLIDKRGLLRIIDRKKHIFKLSQGEYVAPEKLENIYVASGYIAQIFVYGDSMENELVCIAVPDPEYSIKQAIAHKIVPSSTPVEALVPNQPLPAIMQTLVKDAKFQKLVMNDIHALAKSRKLAGFEIPKALYLSGELMSVDNGLLTPTLKLKREVGKEYYADAIRSMYEEIKSKKPAPSAKL